MGGEESAASRSPQPTVNNFVGAGAPPLVVVSMFLECPAPTGQVC